MAKEYLERLSALLQHTIKDPPNAAKLECKHFFSGAALYANGTICITLTPVGLGLKLPETTREKLLATNKAVALRYFPKAPIKKEYVLLPEAANEDAKMISTLIAQSIQYVVTRKDP